MKPLFDAWLIQIEVATVCRLACAHCTRGVPHVAKPSFADLGFIDKALGSLSGWRKGVGCTGGEPTMHPRFADICDLYRRHFPKHQCGLWTSGGASYEKHRRLIEQTFGIINYNDHASSCFHHPLLIASEEVISDEKLRNELIDQCWVQLHWSPIITPKGAFFCEVAATLDMLLGGPGGYPLEAGWWNKGVSDFADQRERYCGRCSMPIPFEPLPDSLQGDYVSRENAQRLLAARAPQALKGRLHVLEDVYTREDILRLRSAQKRRSKSYAQPDSVHFWVKTPLRAWFWKRAKYRHLPGGRLQFCSDTLRFLGLKLHETLVQEFRRATQKERHQAPPGRQGQ